MLIDATGKGLPGVGKLLEPAAQLPDGAKAEATAGSDDDSGDDWRQARTSGGLSTNGTRRLDASCDVREPRLYRSPVPP